MYECFDCMHVSALCTMLCPSRPEERALDHKAGVTRLETELSSSRITLSVLNHRAISPAPQILL